MDETPYPPPAPGTAPPPAQPPAAPPPATGYAPPVAPPAGYGAPAEPPKKSKKTLVIVLVIVGVLLLGCCGAGVAGFLFFWPTEKVITEVDQDTVTDGDTGTDTDTGTSVDPAWDAFSPVMDTSVYVEPSARNAKLAEEIMGVLYPDFVIDEIVCEPGEFDGETYWMDNVYVAASLASDSSVRIVVPLFIQLEEGQADGSSSIDEANVEADETLATTEDGTQYIYYTDMHPALVGGISDPEVIALLAQVQADFPGALSEYEEIEGDTGSVSVTKWEAYPEYAEGFSLSYELIDGTWEYVSSEPW